MASENTSGGVPLPAVAARLRMSWSQAFNAVLSGKLRGHQRSNGRWLVEETSIAEYERGIDPPSAKSRPFSRQPVDDSDLAGARNQRAPTSVK